MNMQDECRSGRGRFLRKIYACTDAVKDVEDRTELQYTILDGRSQTAERHCSLIVLSRLDEHATAELTLDKSGDIARVTLLCYSTMALFYLRQSVDAEGYSVKETSKTISRLQVLSQKECRRILLRHDWIERIRCLRGTLLYLQFLKRGQADRRFANRS